MSCSTILVTIVPIGEESLLTEKELPNFLLIYSGRLYPYVKHLPVSPKGFKHFNTKANAHYRRAELEVWKAASQGKTSKPYLDFIWKLYSKTLHVSDVKLEAILLKVERKI